MSILGPILDSLREAFFMFWETLWALILGFGLSGAVQAFVSRGQMEQVLGRSGGQTVVKATFLGMVSSSCSYAASAMAKSIFQKGATFTAAMVFMIASTNLVVELGIVMALLLGWQFTASEFVGGILMIVMFAVVARYFFPQALIDAARARLRDGGNSATIAAESVQQTPMRTRVVSLAGWSDAASYAIADITMLRRELLIGFGVAGFLSVMVPDVVWSHIFLSGHGFLTDIENAVVGPLIALLSFVCSIGNVPLAAALWKGGISFGGVIAFVFADLITLPLLLIYRKYYGTKVMLRILASFWLVMSLGGLLVGSLFHVLGLVPITRPTTIAPEQFAFNYTSILNVIFLALFAVLYYLHRNRVRFGGGDGYAIDPVCGMQVETRTAPAQTPAHGQDVYFCSDRCAERFALNPDRYLNAKLRINTEATEPTMEVTEPIEIKDPICGMTVDPSTAAATRRHDGRNYFFCREGCATTFDADPERYANPAPAKA